MSGMSKGDIERFEAIDAIEEKEWAIRQANPHADGDRKAFFDGFMRGYELGQSSRTPGPATAKILTFARCVVNATEWSQQSRDMFAALIAEWKEPK